jgi:nicotinamidase-related amidase
VESLDEIKGRTAVLLVDLQTGFMNESNSVVIPALIRFLEFCKEKNVLIFVIKYDGQGKIIPKVQNVLLGARTKIVKKSKDDAFINTSLNTQLLVHGIEFVIPVGVNGCACVRRTTISAMFHQYTVIMSSSLVGCGCRWRGRPCFTMEWYRENVPYFYEEGVPFLDAVSPKPRSFFQKTWVKFRFFFRRFDYY